MVGAWTWQGSCCQHSMTHSRYRFVCLERAVCVGGGAGGACWSGVQWRPLSGFEALKALKALKALRGVCGRMDLARAMPSALDDTLKI
jgi:hypothetical protein